MENTMFGLHATLAAQIFSGVAAAFLILFATGKIGFAKKFGTWVGGIAFTSVLFSIGCTIFYATAYWQAGIYSVKSVASAMTSSMPDSAGSRMKSDQERRAMMESMWNCRAAGNDFDHCYEQDESAH